MALEDISAANGPLQCYPGSHKLLQVTLAGFGVTLLNGRNPYDLYRTVYEPGIAGVVAQHGPEPHEAHLRNGPALVWSANLASRRSANPSIQAGHDTGRSPIPTSRAAAIQRSCCPTPRKIYLGATRLISAPVGTSVA
ncbi:phytanoyl-CoA dioxygenase family protein [Sphingomonas sp. RRHST34]|uniref:Phytanoyl-CoA dioxygenase family protein n=1 Tax=Sphingomonas citri TaxID=2862499 RepID=A0ABS7BSI1_9SPHN|nr:phytanoyl-CoA dioxygenase family protein [Sphingomonas citri]